MDNAIRLLHGEWRLTKHEAKEFQKGDTIWGDGPFRMRLKNGRSQKKGKPWKSSKRDLAATYKMASSYTSMNMRSSIMRKMRTGNL